MSRSPSIADTTRLFARALWTFGVTALLGGAAGCGAAAKEPHFEDPTRLLAPVPACVVKLPARRVKTGLARNMSETGYWRLVFPTFDTEKLALPEDAVPCTGRNVLADPALKGGEWIRRYPVAVEEGEILLGSGGDRIKALWMRTHRFPDGTEAGPLALVRPKDDSAEVYAVGIYRGITKRPLFALERIGPEVVITVQDEGCTGNTKVEPCRSLTSIYLPRRGELARLTQFTAERRDYVDVGEPGSYGRIEYKLTSSSRYTKEGITVFEQMTAKDEGGRELRHAEIERVFTLRDIELLPSEDSLWPHIYPKTGKDEGAPPAGPTAPPAQPPPPAAAPLHTRADAPAPGDAAAGAGRNLRPKYACCDEDLPAPASPKRTTCKQCSKTSN